MSLRRLAVIVVVLGSIAALVVTSRNAPASTQAVFTQLATPSTPYLPLRTKTLTNNYFCPGVPASGKNGGKVVITNPTDGAMSGQVYVYLPQGGPIVVPVDVAARQQQAVDLGALSDAKYVGAMVELDGYGAGVDQTAVAATGSSVAPCTNAPSEHWYFADGTTVDGVDYDLILTNPYPDTASVRLTFATSAGQRTPPQFDGYVIPPHSVRFVDVDGAGARQEQQLSVSVDSLRGPRGRRPVRELLGREPARAVGGARSAGRRHLLGLRRRGDGRWHHRDLHALQPDRPRGPSPAHRLPVGAHVGTAADDRHRRAGHLAGGEPRLPERRAGGAPLRARPGQQRRRGRGDRGRAGADETGAGRGRWRVHDGRAREHDHVRSLVGDARRAGADTEAALVVANTTGTKSAVTVSAVGPGGVVPVPSLSHLPLPPARRDHDRPHGAEVVGKPILVEADDPSVKLAVEQRYPRTRCGRRAAGPHRLRSPCPSESDQAVRRRPTGSEADGGPGARRGSRWSSSPAWWRGSSAAARDRTRPASRGRTRSRAARPRRLPALRTRRGWSPCSPPPRATPAPTSRGKAAVLACDDVVVHEAEYPTRQGAPPALLDRRRAGDAHRRPRRRGAGQLPRSGDGDRPVGGRRRGPPARDLPRARPRTLKDQVVAGS